MSSSGGPGTKSPTTWQCQNMTLSNIAAIAFKLNERQLVSPEWMKSQRFDITAKLPEGTSKAEFYLMLQDLLMKRFGLVYHRETREMQGYSLTIAHPGPAIREVQEPPGGFPAPVRPEGPFSRPHVDSDGYPIQPDTISGFSVSSGHVSGRWQHVPMSRFLSDIGQFVDKPIADNTGLHGFYDISLRWVIGSVLDHGEGPSALESMQRQLGIKANATKVPTEFVVVDNALRVPTEN